MGAVPDPVELARALIRCPSVTPEDAGALDVLQGALEGLGFTCHRQTFSEEGTPDVDNLYARIGTAAPNFCFAGHTDVVPAGTHGGWTVDPFAAEVRDGWLTGRGAADMKAAIAAFVAAAGGFLAERGPAFGGSLSLLITGDEEGPSINGTRKMLAWMRDAGETIDACLVGEPTSAETFGDMIKIGRRGSLNAWITVAGTQGHAAYPDNADNPVPRLLRLLGALTAEPLDAGTEHFPPSNLEVTSVDVGNRAVNVIPAEASAQLNIRFNDQHTGAGLTQWLTELCERHAPNHGLEVQVTGEAFLSPPGPLSDVVAGAVRSVTGTEPALTTTGGTSDARFIKDVCPVAEFGMLNATAHKVDEQVRLDEVSALTRIYRAVLDGYFAG